MRKVYKGWNLGKLGFSGVWEFKGNSEKYQQMNIIIIIIIIIIILSFQVCFSLVIYRPDKHYKEFDLNSLFNEGLLLFLCKKWGCQNSA